MILLVDIGNTRIKFAVLRGMRMGAMRALRHAGRSTAAAAVVRRAPGGIARVVAVNVAGEKFERALVAAVRRRFGIAVEFIRSTRTAGGVRNGYADAWRLGADRWVAAIGAHALAPGRAVVVANAGTALTLDAVTATGRHRGGAIVPGPARMAAAMLEGTHGIARRARGLPASARRLFAADTASALAAGAAFAGAALIDRAVVEAAKTLRARPVLLLTGGGARSLSPHIKSDHRLVPDLVLKGLAVLARD